MSDCRWGADVGQWTSSARRHAPPHLSRRKAAMPSKTLGARPCALLLVLLFAFVLAPVASASDDACASAPDAQVATDRAVYGNLETVHVSGAGYGPGCSL